MGFHKDHIFMTMQKSKNAFTWVTQKQNRQAHKQKKPKKVTTIDKIQQYPYFLPSCWKAWVFFKTKCDKNCAPFYLDPRKLFFSTKTTMEIIQLSTKKNSLQSIKSPKKKTYNQTKKKNSSNKSCPSTRYTEQYLCFLTSCYVSFSRIHVTQNVLSRTSVSLPSTPPPLSPQLKKITTIYKILNSICLESQPSSLNQNHLQDT